MWCVCVCVCVCVRKMHTNTTEDQGTKQTQHDTNDNNQPHKRHAHNPPSGFVTTTRERVCVPASHVAEQADHGAQLETAHGTFFTAEQSTCTCVGVMHRCVGVGLA